jgi:hypothetical protein
VRAAGGGPAVSDDRAPDDWVARLLDLAVFAPVGVAVSLRDELPRHVRQGRQAMENRLQLARFIGQLTVQTGRRELEKRLEERRASRPAEDASGQEPTGQEVTAPGTGAEATTSVAAAGHEATPSADDLPIGDYESVPAINVVERLRTMQPHEIELIRRFEVAHRARRTVLAKIDQLQQRQHEVEHGAGSG